MRAVAPSLRRRRMSPSETIQKRLLDAVAAHRRGDLDAAERAYRAVLASEPRNFDATHLLGVVLYARGRLGEAETLLRRAVALNGKATAAHNNLGNLLKALGRLEDSLVCYGSAVELDPKYADAFANRGNVLDELGRGPEALADYDRTLALNPNHPGALQRSAKLLADAGRHEEALVRNERSLALNAGSAEGWMRSGNILIHLKRPREALESYDKALALNPKYTLCAVNRSAALDALGRPHEALVELDKALALDSRDFGALNNKATILKSLGRLDEALAEYRKALASKPDDANTQSNFAMACLMTGDFESGWRALEHRWAKQENAGKRPSLPFAQWAGEALEGRRILVYAEQGLGDIVQFSRYLPLLQAQGAEVGFLVATKMHAVLHAAFPGVALVDDVAKVCALPYDFCIALMSLPLRFGTRLENVPAAVPYLKADPAKVALWRERIGSRGFRIGIAWQGNPNVSIDAGRSIALAEFAALAQASGARLISLQKNEGAEQLRDAPMPVEDLGADFDAGRDSFVDTLAVVESLDLVITSDTSIAHVAGALGRPVWVALKHVADWRWLRGRADSPWYPTMRLFRQTTAGDWTAVFASMRAELSQASSAAGGAGATILEERS